MTTEEQIKNIEQLTDKILASETEYFKVSIKIKPINNIKVFIDGDNGITIEKCVQFNRKLYKLIEENKLFPSDDFSLEVSSPGVDEPLKLHRQYNKNIGRFIEVFFKDGTKNEGKLLQVTDEDIIIEQTSGKGKKINTQQIIIPFINIQKTIVQIKF
ncbi:MAG: ribosome maturation factor RimP [Chitinophagaceae bacterium]